MALAAAVRSGLRTSDRPRPSPGSPLHRGSSGQLRLHDPSRTADPATGHDRPREPAHRHRHGRPPPRTRSFDAGGRTGLAGGGSRSRGPLRRRRRAARRLRRAALRGGARRPRQQLRYVGAAVGRRGQRRPARRDPAPGPRRRLGGRQRRLPADRQPAPVRPAPRGGRARDRRAARHRRLDQRHHHRRTRPHRAGRGPGGGRDRPAHPPTGGSTRASRSGVPRWSACSPPPAPC